MFPALSNALPILCGTIDRRILVNYRVDPAIAAGLLPEPFRPLEVNGHALAGVCLIRLAHLRPWLLPQQLGLRFENAALRVAVEWDTVCGPRQGVFVLARYTSSRLAAWAGGRVFPGVHEQVDFASSESDRQVNLAFRSIGGTSVRVSGKPTNDWPTDSIFASCAAANRFFAAGSLGYSWNDRHGEFEGMTLCIPRWDAEPFAVNELQSTYFDDQQRFPPGSIAFDHALIMQNVEHEWHVADPIAAAAGDAVHSCHCGDLTSFPHRAPSTIQA